MGNEVGLGENTTPLGGINCITKCGWVDRKLEVRPKWGHGVRENAGKVGVCRGGGEEDSAVWIVGGSEVGWREENGAEPQICLMGSVVRTEPVEASNGGLGGNWLQVGFEGVSLAKDAGGKEWERWAKVNGTMLGLVSW